MAAAEEMQQLRGKIALQTAQLDGATQELTTPRAATVEAEVRSGMSLVDTKL